MYPLLTLLQRVAFQLEIHNTEYPDTRGQPKVSTSDSYARALQKEHIYKFL